MGNCLAGGNQSAIRVFTCNGGVMEFDAPVTVESITDEFPGHGIFRSHDVFWKPLPHSDLLLAGESYQLLPLLDRARVGHVRSSSAPPGSAAAPYRMSFGGPRKEEAVGGGFWKVKLVISPEQLVEILGEEGRTEELIESVRTVAKCGSGGLPQFSDHWSLCSTTIATFSNKDSTAALLDFSN